MVQTGKMQASRYEFKYLISERKARAISRYVQSKLRPDEFTGDKGYYVHSLYLDSSDLRLCKQTVCGEKNRFKLRIRFYDDDPRNPVFLEVKRRVTIAVLKKRACLKRECVDELLDGFLPDPNYLAVRNLKNIDALNTFCNLSQQIDAKPAAYTSYLREAYESVGSNAQRVTFDRELRAGKFTGRLTCENFETWPLIALGGVVFEMKFTDRFPLWMHDLAVMFELDRISVPKYVECINMVDMDRTQTLDLPRRFHLERPLNRDTVLSSGRYRR
jgi:hypothetical protein